ncbi:Vegetative incompatibility protein HET-E-1 [Lachnellula willkommii]|uniref:Vegetative incompatibility protein HET-E-1 n=1 Tax=Lachnellula willkommii TaxID=215461 RepID=A0A559MG04_9HELO|nr:Vegetative incompatibility protein HET-E-1 [Lachnellula willkommii]
MPSYSSHQFYKDWRYSLAEDFTSPSGEPVKYARDGFRTWGSERYRIPFPESPNGASVNSDKSLIAIASKEDIHIYETANFTKVLVLKGHVSPIECFDFHPKDPQLLVSAESGFRPGSPAGESTILFWNLDDEKDNPMLDEKIISKIASEAAETAIRSLQKADPRLDLSPEDEKSLSTAFEPAITNTVKTRRAASRKSLIGRLQDAFQSHIFSPSGSYLIYMPGKRPRSNGNDVWDIKIYSMVTHEDVFTLSGHSDAMMWFGFSPDESMIATVSWDQSMRIWDTENGDQKYVFKTANQNWTGGFSPDSQKFAGTSGDGTLYVYSMVDGTTLVQHKAESGRGWLRALSWSVDSQAVAVGGGHGGGPGLLFLYDLMEDKVTQQRVLSTDACQVEPEIRRMMGGYLECNAVRFVDGGRKVVTLISGDGGFETYDLETWEKWRFARPGVDPQPKEIEADEDGAGNGKEKEIAHGGYLTTIWEDEKRKTIWIASMDSDGVRIWDLPMSTDEAA